MKFLEVGGFCCWVFAVWLGFLGVFWSVAAGNGCFWSFVAEDGCLLGFFCWVFQGKVEDGVTNDVFMGLRIGLLMTYSWG